MRRPYSGDAHGVIAGLGLATCVHVNPKIDQFWPIDYRLLVPDTDGKSKLGHGADMLAQMAPRGISYRTVPLGSLRRHRPV